VTCEASGRRPWAAGGEMGLGGGAMDGPDASGPLDLTGLVGPPAVP
jgi:hypothetical protein